MATTEPNLAADGGGDEGRVEVTGPPNRHVRPTTDHERRAILVIAALAGLGAAFCGAEPTGWAPADVFYCAAFGVVVTLAASRARRWSWIVLAGVAAVPASGVAAVVSAGVALVIAIVGALTRRRRILGALVGAFAVQALLRLPDLGFHGASALVVVAAVTPVFVSAWLFMSRRQHRVVFKVAAAFGVLVVVGGSVLGAAAVLARSSVTDGINATRDGLAESGDGDQLAAAASFDIGASSLASANDTLGAWWVWPARLVPIVGQQAAGLDVASSVAAEVAASAGTAATSADLEQIRYTDGRVDLGALADAQQPLAAASASILEAQSDLAAIDSGWLVAPVRTRLDSLNDELADAAGPVSLAAEGAAVAPAMLGADGPRHYLVIFTQPAESRGLGGFFGSWAELTATDGEVDLTDSGSVTDLLELPGRDERTLNGPPDYVDRYARFRPQYYLQDLTLSPDMPSFAEVVADQFAQLGRAPVDGVIVVDPYGLAALLEITGPVDVEGLDKPLRADDAAEFLVRDQYLDFPDESARKDFLEDAGRATFDALVSGSLPGPRKVGDVLGPAVAGRHIMVWIPGTETTTFIDHLGVTGSIVAPDGGDAFMVVTQNKGNNKIDSYLHRDVTYLADYDPTSGALVATATVVLRNDAPAEGLPDSIIGSNDQGLPPGTNALWFNFYTPHRLSSAALDGEPLAMEFQRELGYAVYSRFVQIPPGGSVTLTLQLNGSLTTGSDYRLSVGYQPLVNPDAVRAEASFPMPWVVTSVDGFGPTETGRDVIASIDPVRPVVLSAGLLAE